MPTSNHQRQQRRAAARRASVATDDVPDAVPRPPGRGPRNHFWDPRPPGVWRHNESNEPFQSRAARLASARGRHAAAVRGRRWSRINAARCNEAMWRPGFDHSRLELLDVGDLGRTSVPSPGGGSSGSATGGSGDGALACYYCGALLWPGEAKPVPKTGGCKRGRACCAEGQVHVPEVQLQPAIERLWRDDTPRAKTLRKYSRQFNNALALASEMYDEVDLDGWAPSIVIEGKLYQQIGPLRPGEQQAEGFAQLYVHDPAAEDDEAVCRARHMPMYMKKGASNAEKTRVLELLGELQGVLKESNSYVKDFVHANEIYSQGEVTDAHFVIEATGKPDADKRTYKGEQAFTEVSVLAVEPRGGKVPKRSIMVRHRGGGLHFIDESHRAYDPLHFVLLFPCGDDGWHDGISLNPKGSRAPALHAAPDRSPAAAGTWHLDCGARLDARVCCGGGGW